MQPFYCLAFSFSRGSKDVSMKAVSQFKLSPNFRMISLRCSGNEEHIYDCLKNTQETCKVVGEYRVHTTSLLHLVLFGQRI